ncbi:MAG: DUF951 domain-containing protein [Bacilli bacterium]|jgi:hypothetical protein
MQQKLELYDLVEMKKPHPCNARTKIFQIVRLGADVKIQCQGCGRIILLTRIQFNERFKQFISHQEEILFNKD